METKQCKGCERVEPLSDFYRANHRSGGYSPLCKMCDYIRRLLYKTSLDDEKREQLLERKRAYNRQFNKMNRDKVLAQKREYYEANRERILEYVKNRSEERSEQLKQYRETNRGMFRNYVRMRKKKLRGRTFPEQRKAIEMFYQNCPEGYHVDHIVPITHPLVSGLHVLANLQYLTASENSAKRNRFTIE